MYLYRGNCLLGKYINHEGVQHSSFLLFLQEFYDHLDNLN